MDASLLAVLNDDERLIVAQAEAAELAGLDEDAAIELETRIRRARNKYTGQYRRAASARVAEHGGRGKARPENRRAALKAEAFENALSRVSRQVAVLARKSAAALRVERLAAARAAKQSARAARQSAGSARQSTRAGGQARHAVPAPRQGGPAAPPEPTGDRALRSPAREKQRAGTKAAGARKQARRDSRRSAAR